jgi:hypothetical protein
MKHLFAGIAAMLFGLGATQANALTASIPSNITPGSSFSVEFDVATPGLYAFDFYFQTDPSLILVDSVTDVEGDGTQGSYFGYSAGSVIPSTSAASGGGYDYTPATSFSAFTVVSAAGAPGFEVFKLNFVSSPFAVDTFFNFVVDRYIGTATTAQRVTGTVDVDFAEAPAIPLPAGAPLVISGLAAMAMLRRRKSKAA